MVGRRVEVPAINCAVYTRKSTEEGLEQEFNSLDAQRDAGEAFIASQKSEGWVCLPDRNDDGGFTGGNVERPALKRLMADIDAGRVDCVVVYKVDRLSRSLVLSKKPILALDFWPEITFPRDSPLLFHPDQPSRRCFSGKSRGRPRKPRFWTH